MATPLYLNGFENRVFAVGGASTDGFWSALAGPTNTTVTADTAVHRGNGAYSMKHVYTANVATQAAYTTDAYAAQTKLAARFFFRKTANSTSSAWRLLQQTVAGSTFFFILLDTSGRLIVNASGGTSPTDSAVTAALNNDQWYLVDLVIDVSTTAYVARLWLDGTAVASDATITGAAAGSMTSTIIGKTNSSTSTVGLTEYFDDFIVGTASSITDKFGDTDGIVGIVPGGDGTHSPSPPTATHFQDAGNADIAWNGSSGNVAYDQLDSGDLTQVAEYVSQDVAGATEYLELNFGTTTLSASAPVAVQGEVSLDSDHASSNAFTADTRMRNGSTETVLFSGDWSTASQWWKVKLVTVANQSELDGLTMRIGYGSAQPAIPYWTALMYEVDVGKSSGTVYEKQNASVLF